MPHDAPSSHSSLKNFGGLLRPSCCEGIPLRCSKACHQCHQTEGKTGRQRTESVPARRWERLVTTRCVTAARCHREGFRPGWRPAAGGRRAEWREQGGGDQFISAMWLGALRWSLIMRPLSQAALSLFSDAAAGRVPGARFWVSRWRIRRLANRRRLERDAAGRIKLYNAHLLRAAERSGSAKDRTTDRCKYSVSEGVSGFIPVHKKLKYLQESSRFLEFWIELKSLIPGSTERWRRFYNT